MKIKPFKIERFFAKYEFSVQYLLSCSDCEPLKMNDLIAMANEESLKLWNNLSISYTESQGHSLLRHEITKLYNTVHDSETLVIVPEEGIFIVMNVLLETGDHVVTCFPAYQSLYEIAKSINCEVSNWEPDNNNKFDIEKLFALTKANTKLIVINFPHNPTGALISKDDLKSIIEFARKRNIFILSDEMYRFLEYDEKDRLPSVSDIYENAITLCGMSKSFALPGLRIGWLNTKNKEIFKILTEFKDYTTICSAAPSEILAIIALQNKNKIISKNLEIINKNLHIIDQFAKKHQSVFKWFRPIAGSIAFPEFIINEPIEDFCKKLIEKKDAMLLPSSVYDYQIKSARLGFGRENFPEALEKLDEYLTENLSTI